MMYSVTKVFYASNPVPDIFIRAYILCYLVEHIAYFVAFRFELIFTCRNCDILSSRRFREARDNSVYQFMFSQAIC